MSDPAADERERRIIDVIMLLDEGEVTTYGDIAAMAGYPKLSRLVGRILSRAEVEMPWWRVVNASGRLVPGNEPEHAALLRAENVTVVNGRVTNAPEGRFARRNPHT